MNHIHLAHNASICSDGRLVMSELSLPDYERNLNDLVEFFDDDDRRGVWLVSIREEMHSNVFNPVVVMFGDHDEVLKAAFCLQPFADVEHKYRQRVGHFVKMQFMPASFNSVVRLIDPLQEGEDPFMSFPEFVATRTENVNDCNSNWTGIESDDEDHVKGFFYGPQYHRILLTENEHTDMVGLVYHDWGYAEENQTELEALAYRCYLHSLNILSDEEIRAVFPLPFRDRRKSLTY